MEWWLISWLVYVTPFTCQHTLRRNAFLFNSMRLALLMPHPGVHGHGLSTGSIFMGPHHLMIKGWLLLCVHHKFSQSFSSNVMLVFLATYFFLVGYRSHWVLAIALQKINSLAISILANAMVLYPFLTEILRKNLTVSITFCIAIAMDSVWKKTLKLSKRLVEKVSSSTNFYV